jgi:hypothetical protein
MLRGEPKDHEIFARNDGLQGFFRSLFSPAQPQNADLEVGATPNRTTTHSRTCCRANAIVS